MPIIYNKKLEEIRTKLRNKNIWCSIDETTDSLGRYVALAVVGVMDGYPSEVLLLNCEQLEKVNFSTISRFFDKSMQIIWPGGIKQENVLLLATDAAPYMIKAAKSLRALYFKMVHVTCLAHGFHRLSEEIRSNFPKVDKLIGNIKKIFLKSPSRIELFRDMAPSLPLPPSPVLTRWGTWLQACEYYAENYSKSLY